MGNPVYIYVIWYSLSHLHNDPKCALKKILGQKIDFYITITITSRQLT